MSLWSYIPGRGKKTTREKIRKLEEEAGSLPIIFGVFITKIFENMVAGQLSLALNFAVAAAVVALIYIYMREIKRAASNAKETVEETVTEK